MIFGPVGFALGGTLRGIYSYMKVGGKFKPVSHVIMYKMDEFHKFEESELPLNHEIIRDPDWSRLSSRLSELMHADYNPGFAFVVLQKRIIEKTKNDLGFLTFDLRADLMPLFNWNVSSRSSELMPADYYPDEVKKDIFDDATSGYETLEVKHSNTLDALGDDQDVFKPSIEPSAAKFNGSEPEKKDIPLDDDNEDEPQYEEVIIAGCENDNFWIFPHGIYGIFTLWAGVNGYLQN